MTSALPNNQEDREVYLREHTAARFVNTITDVRGGKADTVILSIGAFAGEPEVLYVALEYAYYAGVSLHMAPQ